MADTHSGAEHLDPSDPPVSLQPSEHRRHIRLIQSRIRALDDPNSPQCASLVQYLRAAYAAAADKVALTPSEWQIYLALCIHQYGQVSLDLSQIQELLELHRQSTLQLLDYRLYLRYLQLALHYFSLHSHVPLPSSLFDREEEQSDEQEAEPQADSAVVASEDPLATWTGLQGGPLLFSSTSCYVPASLPQLDACDEPSSSSLDSSEPSVLGLESVRSIIREAYTRSAYHLSNSDRVWRLYLAFETALLNSGKVDRSSQLETVKQVYLARLGVPHKSIEATFQQFSRFVTNHLPAQSYESELSAANKVYAHAKKIYQARERYEDSVAFFDTLPPAPLDSSLFTNYWNPYLRWQSNRVRRSSSDNASEVILAAALYERAISIFGTQPPASPQEETWLTSPPASDEGSILTQTTEPADPEVQQRLDQNLATAEGLWSDYVTTLSSTEKPDASLVLDVCDRWTRVLPTSTLAYVTHMRQLCRFRRSKPHVEEVFARIMAPGAAKIKGADLVELLVARVDCERHFATQDLALESPEGLLVDAATNLDKFMEVYALISYALDLTASVPATERDQTLRLERYAVDWVERAVNAVGGSDSEAGAGLNDLAETVWQNLVKAQSQNPRVYRFAAGYWSRRADTKAARGWYKGGVSKFEKMMTNPNNKPHAVQPDTTGIELLLDEWVQFEHQRGNVEDIDHAVSKAKHMREIIWEAWYASYSAQQQQQQDYANGTLDTKDVEMTTAQADSTQDASIAAGKKRKTEDETETSEAPQQTDSGDNAADSQKRAKLDESKDPPPRDREKSSVLLSGLPAEVPLGAIRSFLRDCGTIVDIMGPRKVTDSDGVTTAAALVEFSDREEAASALTRDMKRIQDQEVSVSLGWRCTLFVTNFPEGWSDQDARELFGRYGSVFDVRWPSRRFVTTRRFCYVQYTTPSAAQDALVCDKLELSPTCTLQVALSDPERRKTRSDANKQDREVCISGLGRSMTDEDVKAAFSAYGTVTGVRMGRGGRAFVDLSTGLEAQRAMRELNGTTLRGKVVSVTRPLNRGGHGTVQLDRKDDGRRERSVIVSGVPLDAEDALIQQSVERHTGASSVKRVLWKRGDASRQAVVEFADPRTVGKALLLSGITYMDGEPLTLSAPDAPAALAASSSSTKFVPRAGRGGRGRGRGRGLGRGRGRGLGYVQPETSGDDAAPSRPTGQGQDAFRAMLSGSK